MNELRTYVTDQHYVLTFETRDKKAYEQVQCLCRLLIDGKKVDAMPVRHGRWIEVDVGDCCYSCSECGFIRDAYLLDISNYCPKCGAKMEKENL